MIVLLTKSIYYQNINGLIFLVWIYDFLFFSIFRLDKTNIFNKKVFVSLQLNFAKTFNLVLSHYHILLVRIVIAV